MSPLPGKRVHSLNASLSQGDAIFEYAHQSLFDKMTHQLLSEARKVSSPVTTRGTLITNA
jgi:hypothetical protein